jgi:hypothetical protein
MPVIILQSLEGRMEHYRSDGAELFQVIVDRIYQVSQDVVYSRRRAMSCTVIERQTTANVDKEAKYWFNTRTGPVFERSFKFLMEVNPDVVNWTRKWSFKDDGSQIVVLGEGTKWIPNDSGSR